MAHVISRTKRLFTLIKALKGEERIYTEGSINRALILLAIPMVLEMSMESLFALVDAYSVSPPRQGRHCHRWPHGICAEHLFMLWRSASALAATAAGGTPHRRKRP